MSSLGNLTVLTGPSGVGKGTIVRKILESHSDVWLSRIFLTIVPLPTPLGPVRTVRFPKDDITKSYLIYLTRIITLFMKLKG